MLDAPRLISRTNIHQQVTESLYTSTHRPYAPHHNSQGRCTPTQSGGSVCGVFFSFLKGRFPTLSFLNECPRVRLNRVADLRKPDASPHLCSLAMRWSSLSSLPRKPFAKGLFSIFNWVIWAQKYSAVLFYYYYYYSDARVTPPKKSRLSPTDSRGLLSVRGPADGKSSLHEAAHGQHSSAADARSGADAVHAS